MTEPDLAFGDAGQRVFELQRRLQAVGLYDATLDGEFGEHTVAAVTVLQDKYDVVVSGAVDAATWDCLLRAEEEAGMVVCDPVVTGMDDVPFGAPSEDEEWSWDGERWQPREVADALGPGADPPAGDAAGDAQWLWDGDKWQPAL